MILSKKALSALRRQLKHGDYRKVAGRLGGRYTEQYVAMVANGTGGRSNQAIIDALIAQAQRNKSTSERLTKRIAQLK